MFNTYDDILTVEELSEALRIGKKHIYRLLNDGKLKGFRIGRKWKVSIEMLEKFVKEQSH